MSKEYWFWQAEQTYRWSVIDPGKRWETFTYLYLFKWAGYSE